MEATETAEQPQESRCEDSEMLNADEIKEELHPNVEERLQTPAAPMEINSAEYSEAKSERNQELLDSMLEEDKLEELQSNKVESIASSCDQSNMEVIEVECLENVQNEVNTNTESGCGLEIDDDLKIEINNIDDWKFPVPNFSGEAESTSMEVDQPAGDKENEKLSTNEKDSLDVIDVDKTQSDSITSTSISVKPETVTDTVASEEMNLDAADKNPVDKDPVDKDPVDKDPTDKDPVDKDPTDKDPVDKDPTDKDPKDKDPKDKDPKDKDHTDKDSLDKDSTKTDSVDKDPVNKNQMESTQHETAQETVSVSEEVKETSASDKSAANQAMETEPEKVPEVGKDPAVQTSVQECNNIDQENSEDGSSENPVFVHVNTENEKEDDDKNRTESETQEIQDDEDFQNSQPQEDPIASDDFAPVQMDEENEETEPAVVDEEQGASEELCIIPDTERVISQEEKDAAAAMVPLRDPTDANTNSNDKDSAPKDVPAAQVSDTASGNYIISTCSDENVNTCMQCCLPRKSTFKVVNNKKTSFICDDNCLNSLNEKYGDKVVVNLRIRPFTSGINNDNMVSKVKFHRKCMECDKKILNDEFNLSWETMEFCNEFCLSKYQKRIGSNCANCQVEVRSNCLGKYCVRFGYDIRQFCSSVCLEEYKKGLKVCSYCQKDMSGGGDGFLAPIGDKGQFKDFCTQQCMEKYDIMSNNREQPISKAGSTCSVCLNEKPITIEFEHDKKMNLFCGEPCFVAFKFVNNITPGKCDMCRKYFDNKILEEHSMHYDSAQHSFCSKSCQNIYIIAHRKIVPCSWCKVKKYNFDMIKRNFSSGPVLMMCSLNCLSLYQVSVNAVNSKKINCDHCRKSLQPLYHLTMSDATIRNFCSYSCVMAFQNQFPKTPITLNEPEETSTPVPTGAPKRSKRITAKNSEPAAVQADVPTIPVISSVQSLATTNGPTPTNTKTSRAKNGTDASSTMNANSTPPIVKTLIKQLIIVKPAPIPPQRNMATMCKVVVASKGTNHKPTTANKEVQTDELQDKTSLIPVPVPIYVPSPLWMYSMPFPIPFPFPLPVPVPIFIPTTRNSATGIMKEIKKIQVKIPTDPFEAELLMMAEMVAGDKKEDNTESESEEEDTTDAFPAAADEGTFSPEPVDASNTFGDDMLQMALKMATELDEPAVDLEGALTASTITASQGGETPVGTEEAVDDPQPIHHMMERQAIRGRKRPGRPPRSAASKRGRRSSSQMDIPLMAPPQPPPPPEPVEKPDANMCLKYTFGVNAWKQWVTTKNAELEKSSRRVKLFKPEILQLTADELNYSLCLFVKEVRKPNGQEYAPDTIYYLCLGIQQYLFENGRIDNIFCDSYYEKFTDCLDEVAKKFSVLYNDSHYIVTRVEEEHLWESKQLGAHSPHVLLSTLMFFNTKHFNLTTVDEHMQLSFSHIMKHWKRNPNQPGTNKVAGSRNVLLRFYPPQMASESSTRKKKVYEQQENEDNPLRCPVKLYEFYLSKCPESVKTRNDVFYLLPERSCVPDSPVWYSTMPLPRNALEKMLHRVKMVKEINVALLTS